MRPPLNRPSLTILILAQFFAAPAARADSVVSPIYKSWAKYKPGTKLVIRATTEVPSGIFLTTTYSELKSIDDQKIVIKSWTISKSNTGEVSEATPSEHTVRKMFPLFPGIKKEDIGRPVDAQKKGKERIKVMGKDVETEWYEVKGSTEAGPSTTTSWLSDEIPGMLVKAVTHVPIIKKTVTLEIIEMKPAEPSK